MILTPHFRNGTGLLIRRSSAGCLALQLRFLVFCLLWLPGQIVFPAPQFGDSAWQCFRGDSALAGIAPGRLPDRMKVAWTYRTGENDGVESSAAIDSGTAYLGTLDGFLYALE